MAEENEDAEPSMDNILSSIREILSEDEQAEKTAEQSSSVTSEAVASGTSPNQINREAEVAVEAGASAPEVDNNVSRSNQEFTENPLNAELDVSNADVAALNQPQSGEGHSGNGILELTQQMIAQPPPNIGAGDTILSTGPSANSTDALQELAKALLSKRDIAIGNKDLTLEGLVREILRPLLREWLDQNLPYLIERLVKKEIDHMVNRAERLDL